MSFLGRCLGIAAVLLAATIVARPTGADSSEAPPTPAQAAAILDQALSIRYDCDVSARLLIVMTSRRGETRTREVHALTMRRESRMHSLVRVLAPAHLRGLTVMTVEAEGRLDDSFVYLPSLGRTRRVSKGRGSDAFLGSDLTYHDMEWHRASDYSVLGASWVLDHREAAIRIETRPLLEKAWSRADFLVALSDHGLLAVSYYRGGRDPVRTLSASRSSLERFGRNLIPRRLEVTNHSRGTTTSIEILDIEVNPEVDHHVFSVGRLEANRSLRLPSAARRDSTSSGERSPAEP